MRQKPLRILHGMVNVAGIGRNLADWQRKQGAISDFIVYRDNPLFPNSHFNLHLEAYPRIIRLLIKLIFFLLASTKYDLFNFYYGETLLPQNLDLPILRLLGKKIIMTYCGSDIRLIEIEKKRNPYHRLLDFAGNKPELDRRKKKMMSWHNLWVDKFIAPRGIYASATTIIPPKKLIKDLWIHNILDMHEYTPDYKIHEIPIVVHAPSDAKKKGSEYVRLAIEQLRKRGYNFEYIQIEGIPHDQVIPILRDQADIIIDQLLLGGFGTLAVEGMYYGKPVCCYVLDMILQEIPDLPLVNCTIDNLTERLAWLIEHPEERIRIGQAGRAFVERHFDLDKVNAKLWQLYLELLQK